jgi:hypothetical protein
MPADLPYLSRDSLSTASAASHKRLSSPALKVSVYPGDVNYANNILFNPSWIVNSGWCDAMVSLYDLACSKSIEIATSDIVPLQEADIILFVNLPRFKQSVIEVRELCPNACLVLLACESPAVQPHSLVPANLSIFDVVFTYSQSLVATSANCHLMPPGSGYVPKQPPSFIPFAQRRFAILVNSNINTGVLRSPRPWQLIVPFISIRRNGWTLPLKHAIQTSLHTRYYMRRRFAKAAARLRIADFDIYGRGWEPLRSGWFYRFFPEKQSPHWRGTLNTDKLDTLCHYKYTFCYENYSGNEGYISEKIFDALAAGSVPLCLGDRRLKQWFPAGSVVFREDFASDEAMIRDLLNWDESKWLSYYNAGQAFIRSDRFKRFLPDTFARRVIDVLSHATCK